MYHSSPWMMNATTSHGGLWPQSLAPPQKCDLATFTFCCTTLPSQLSLLILCICTLHKHIKCPYYLYSPLTLPFPVLIVSFFALKKYNHPSPPLSYLDPFFPLVLLYSTTIRYCDRRINTWTTHPRHVFCMLILVSYHLFGFYYINLGNFLVFQSMGTTWPLSMPNSCQFLFILINACTSFFFPSILWKKVRKF